MTTRRDRQRDFLHRAFNRMLDRFAAAAQAMAREQTRLTDASLAELYRSVEKLCETFTRFVEMPPPRRRRP